MKQYPLAVREEVESNFDRVLESETGAIIYAVPPQRAEYLCRQARFIKDEAALESTQLYSPDNPYYGRGMYWSIRFRQVKNPSGVLFTLTSEVELTDSQRLINAAFLGIESRIPHSSLSEAKSHIAQFTSKRAKMLRRAEAAGTEYPELQTLAILLEETDLVIRAPDSVAGAIEEISQAEATRLLEESDDG
jgi:hypothetical protein